MQNNAEYRISVSNIFDAESFEDAVDQMVHWLNEHTFTAGYWVSNLETGESRFIDAENLSECPVVKSVKVFGDHHALFPIAEGLSRKDFGLFSDEGNAAVKQYIDDNPTLRPSRDDVKLICRALSDDYPEVYDTVCREAIYDYLEVKNAS